MVYLYLMIKLLQTIRFLISTSAFDLKEHVEITAERDINNTILVRNREQLVSK